MPPPPPPIWAGANPTPAAEPPLAGLPDLPKVDVRRVLSSPQPNAHIAVWH